MSEKNIREEKERLKELITDISHQIKTPLTNIKMYSQLLSEVSKDDVIKDYVNEISLHSKKLEDLINALTKMSRLEVGIFHYKEEEVLLSEIVNKVAEQGHPKALCKNIVIDSVISGDTIINADKKWVSEAVYNILDNAIKYSEEDTRIRISIFCFEMFCGISISDRGPGISEDEIPRIFNRFYRGCYSDESDGIGVGLFLARQIIEDHGGYIRVKSKVGIGSTFDICFPILSKVKE
ncbi:sensor histidine kinase [Streptococcus halotolerans]|uniref:sensor histidine kinase n=1 Tax=Streptococcus halotolerans TaxID=1814128 RepID=UPI00155EC1B6|nr:HAMP domain-containing sensor histidine kinase [Streptococcus halotolerans]